jgi:hypothetical protein
MQVYAGFKNVMSRIPQPVTIILVSVSVIVLFMFGCGVAYACMTLHPFTLFKLPIFSLGYAGTKLLLCLAALFLQIGLDQPQGVSDYDIFKMALTQF